MAYAKVTWAETTPLDAVNLGQMDTGIADAHDGLSLHEGASNPHSGSASTTALNNHASDTGDSAHDNMGRVASGTYTGTGGTTASPNPQKISLPFTPRLVIVVATNAMGDFGADSGLAMWLQSTSGNTPLLTPSGATMRSQPRIVTNGFEVSTNDGMNINGYTYRYTAIG